MSVKICGFTRAEDIETAIGFGADAIGIVLDPSPQQVSPEQARILARACRGAMSVAVTGPTDPEGVARAFALGFDVVQAVMPDESWARVDPGLPVLPVLFDAPDLVLRAQRLLELGRPPTPLGALDIDGGGGGGRGVVADWSRAAACAKAAPVMLSGGLRDDSIFAAMETVGPVAVDVSSFTEARPGVKDPQRMRAFIQAARLAAAALTRPSPPDPGPPAGV